MNILQIVLTNTSTIDTSLPLLWHIRNNYPKAKIVILYCVSNKEQVLRESKYISRFCLDYDITQVDLSDFLTLPKSLKTVWRDLFKSSYNDSYSIKKVIKSPRKILKKKYRNFVGMAIKKKLEYLFCKKFVSFQNLDQFIKPDIIFFDLREKIRFGGRDKLFSYLYQKKITTLLLPHSPHDIREDIGLASFDEFGQYFPEFCKYWIPFKYSRIEQKKPERSGDFLTLGYPAFDSKWIDFQEKKLLNDNKSSKKIGLILIRNFYDVNAKVPEGEFFTVSYKVNMIFLNRLADSLKKLSHDVHLIIKPHPKASLPRTKELLENSNLENYTISYEPFFEQIKHIDFVVSTYTTSLLLTQICGVPTILVEDYVQKYVNEWKVLEDMYKGLSMYVEENDSLSDKIKIALETYDSRRDIYHLRSYFPDNNLDNAEKLLNNIILANK